MAKSPTIKDLLARIETLEIEVRQLKLQVNAQQSIIDIHTPIGPGDNDYGRKPDDEVVFQTIKDCVSVPTAVPDGPRAHIPPQGDSFSRHSDGAGGHPLGWSSSGVWWRR